MSEHEWVEITLHNSEKVALVDRDDAALVAPYRWYLAKGGMVQGYRGSRDGKPVWVSLGRLLMGATDRWVFIDHISGSPLDNRRANLRPADPKQSTHNIRAHRDSVSGYKGVSPDRRTWRATIYHEGKTKSLGSTATPEEAARLYDEAARELRGEFARLNFPRVGERAARG